MGHLVHALYVFGLAGRLGIAVQLRMEDHDRQRCRHEYARAIEEDFAWLGLTGPGRPWQYQSQRKALYTQALAGLPVYACHCSRSEILARTGRDSADELGYDGHCRHKSLDRAGAALRLQIPDTKVLFEDLRLGPQQQCPASQCGDLLLYDRNGNETYQWAVAVDDLAVNVVIRGEDLLASTGRQLLLRRMLGQDEPMVWLHHPLLYEPGTSQKLSKRQHSESLRQRKEKGALAPVLLGEAAHLAGLIPRPKALAASEIASLFS
jgi:glutamyl-tRNA synthetase/glutamyl-Q tRNA(Asp) synthetase